MIFQLKYKIYIHLIKRLSVHGVRSYLCVLYLKWMNVIVLIFIDENCHGERGKNEKVLRNVNEY